MTKEEQKELQENLRKNRIAAHQMWLNDITTVTLVQILHRRIDKFKQQLFESVLVKTDEEFQNKFRLAITTLQAEIEIITNSDKFVELAVTINKENK